MTNVLMQVVDSTVGGRQAMKVSECSKDKVNTALGLLDWNNWYRILVVPTVYSKEKWVKRKLLDTELCDALDVPGWVREESSKAMLRELTILPIPGEIFNHVLQGVKKTNSWSPSQSISSWGQKKKG